MNRRYLFDLVNIVYIPEADTVRLCHFLRRFLETLYQLEEKEISTYVSRYADVLSYQK